MILAVCSELPGTDPVDYGSIVSVVFIGSGLGALIQQPVEGFLRDLMHSFFPGLLFYVAMSMLAAILLVPLDETGKGKIRRIKSDRCQSGL
jgi:uncharacterized SAM-dependent methyltransferase